MKGGLLGCMGVGVPFAIGTKLANPKKEGGFDKWRRGNWNELYGI